MPATEKSKVVTAISTALFQEALLEDLEEEDNDSSTDSARSDADICNVEWSQEDEEGGEAAELADLYCGLVQTRYMEPRENVTRSTAHRYNLFQQTPKEFRQSVRVDPATFDCLLSLIVDDRIFYNDSENPQTDIAIQLAVTLEWCGTFGNGNTCGRLARSYGLGSGTITEFVHRVRKSLLRHYSHFVAWPSATKRATSSAFHRERYGLSGAVGFVDGTYVNFSQKPHVDGHLYFTRKKRHGLNVQVFCDEDQRILHAFTGWPGSCGDSLVFSHSQVSKTPDQFFSLGEYLVGDSGYALSERLLTPFKMPRAAQPDNACFNIIVSSARVVNENCIGTLKNRWSSLYGVRTQIKAKCDFESVNNHILLCVLLHNIALQIADPWTEEDREDFSAAEEESDDEDEDDQCYVYTPPTSQNAEKKRELIKGQVLRYY